MPPSKSSLEPYKHVIWSWYILENRTIEDTRFLLQHTYPIVTTINQWQDFPSTCTLECTIKDWSCKKQIRSLESQKVLLGARLWVLFYDFGLSNAEIIHFMHHEGFSISQRT